MFRAKPDESGLIGSLDGGEGLIIQRRDEFRETEGQAAAGAAGSLPLEVLGHEDQGIEPLAVGYEADAGNSL